MAPEEARNGNGPLLHSATVWRTSTADKCYLGGRRLGLIDCSGLSAIRGSIFISAYCSLAPKCTEALKGHQYFLNSTRCRLVNCRVTVLQFF